MHLKVLVVGDVGLDLYVRCSAVRLCPEAPVPVLSPDTEESVPGLAGNVAANLVAMGASPRLVGVIGDDQDGVDLRDALEQKGVEGLERTLLVSPSRKTTVKTRYTVGGILAARVDRECVDPVVFGESVIEGLRKYLTDCDVVIVQDYGKGFVVRELMTEVIASGKPVLVDPFIGADPFLYRGVTLLKPNRLELEQMQRRLGVGDPGMICDALGIGSLVVTRGSEGIYGCRGDEEVDLPAISVRCVDVCGAGDAVAASLAIGLAMKSSFRRMLEVANAAGAAAVTIHGTSVVTSEMVGELMGVENDEGRA